MASSDRRKQVSDSEGWVAADEEGFLYGLAAFIDGEGCFKIRRSVRAGRVSYSPLFQLGLRRDDRPLLEAIRRRTGLGRIRDTPISPATAARVPGAHPLVEWRFGSKRDCATLVRLLEGRLGSKKRRDFEIWREAVRRWAMKRGNGHRVNDWSDLARLKRELEAVRSVGLAAAAGGEWPGLRFEEPETLDPAVFEVCRGRSVKRDQDRGSEVD